MLYSNQKAIDPFFTWGKHKHLIVKYSFQSFFDLQEEESEENSIMKFLLEQTIKDVENTHRVIVGFDMTSEDFL